MSRMSAGSGGAGRSKMRRWASGSELRSFIKKSVARRSVGAEGKVGLLYVVEAFGNNAKALRASQPLPAGQRLHVFLGVDLIHNLKTEKRLDGILHCHKPLHAAVFVDHKRDVFTIVETPFEEIGQEQDRKRTEERRVGKA